MKCYFCGSYAYSKITVIGKENKKRRQKNIFYMKLLFSNDGRQNVRREVMLR